MPYQPTLEAARGGMLIGGYAPREFRRLVIAPGTEQVFRAYSDRTRPPRGAVVTWDGEGSLDVEVLDEQGHPVPIRDAARVSATRIELLSKDVPRYFYVRIANPGAEPVTYDIALHVWLAAEP